MTTTIQIGEDTMQKLKQLQQALNVKTYNDVIKALMQEKKSMYGFLGRKNMKWVLKDLRDKHDRF